MATSTGQTSHDQALGDDHKEVTAFGIIPPRVTAEQRDPFDSARISRWAAHSATGPSTFLDHGVMDQGSLSYTNDLVPASISSQLPSGLSLSSPDAFDAPLHAAPVHLQYGQGLTYNEISTAGAGNAFPRTCLDHEISQDQGFNYVPSFDGDAYYNGLSSDMNSHAYSAFGPGEFLPPDPLGARPPLLLGNDNHNELTNSSGWDAARADLAQPLDWSPVTEITPSSSSMQSSNSFLGHQPDPSVSGLMYDGIFTAGQNAQIDGDNVMIPSFNLAETTVDPSSMSYLDHESTIRPHQNFQRAPLPTLDTWSGLDVASPTYGGSTTYTGYEGSRRSSEVEPKVPRDHAFYRATPKDGLYHCPFATTDNCTHKPEKLKCNYDKHLDSHLKPYRCKSFECSQIQFSSTACLLRHEREAHGMHGHGPKPHLCYFKDCERAQEDNGFPRRWNLFDHMKRVHDFAGTEPSNKSNSPAPSSGSPEPHTDLPKKRRTPSPIAEGPAKRVKVNAVSRSVETNSTGPQKTVKAKPTAVEPEYQLQSLDQLWYDQLIQVQTRLQSLNPRDPRQWQQYQAETAQLQTLRLSMQFQHAQLAH